MAAATVFVCVVLFVCVCAMCNAGSEVQGPIHHDQKYEQKRDGNKECNPEQRSQVHFATKFRIVRGSSSTSFFSGPNKAALVVVHPFAVVVVVGFSPLSLLVVA